jgi:hypothetical protein
MAYYWFYSAAPPESFAHLPLVIPTRSAQRRTRHHYPGRVHHRSAAVTTIHKCPQRILAGRCLYLGQGSSKGIAIVNIFGKILHSHYYATVLGYGYGNLGAKFVPLMNFAFAHAQNIRLMNTEK